MRLIYLRHFNVSHWDIGKVYKRLIIGIMREEKRDVIDAIFTAYHLSVCDIIDNYNANFYYENADNILISYLTGVIE